MRHEIWFDIELQIKHTYLKRAFAIIELMIVNILISVVAYLVLMYVSVNLLGLLVRGLFTNPELDKLKSEGHEFIKKEIEKSQRADKWINVFALILIIGYFYALFHFWNIGVVAVAIIIMVGRLPDLVWEIKHGKKVDPNLMKHNAMYYITSFLPWIGLPLLYYFLYVI